MQYHLSSRLICICADQMCFFFIEKTHSFADCYKLIYQHCSVPPFHSELVRRHYNILYSSSRFLDFYLFSFYRPHRTVCYSTWTKSLFVLFRALAFLIREECLQIRDDPSRMSDVAAKYFFRLRSSSSELDSLFALICIHNVIWAYGYGNGRIIKCR